jgi:MoxR-like ATPase
MEQAGKTFERYRALVENQRLEIRKRIIGQSKLIEALFLCFYAHSERKLGPHLLVEGKVGKGKTATLDTFTRTISGAAFSRIQFTPDLRPLDLIRIVEQHEDRSLKFHPGPLFANLVLADEINRASEKTRAALLEAMGEKQITLGGATYPLEEPFFVMATENPLDVEGTFMLGAAQLDRFMMKVDAEPLSEDEEMLLALSHQDRAPEIQPVVSKAEVLDIQDFIRSSIRVDPKIRRDMIRIVRELRPESGLLAPDDFYLLPEGERSYLYLERAAKVRAFLAGRTYVTFSDIAVLAAPVLNHRIGFQHAYSSSAKTIKARELIARSVAKVVEDGARGH